MTLIQDEVAFGLQLIKWQHLLKQLLGKQFPIIPISRSLPPSLPSQTKDTKG